MRKNIEKIKQLLENKLNDPAMVYFLTLVRKELENLNESDCKRFNTLKFYCDWILHNTIDRSKAGSSIIVDINQIIIIFLPIANNVELIKTISTLLIVKFKKQLLNFLKERSIQTTITNDSKQWKNFLKILFCNLENTPVLIHKKDKDTLKSHPIKPGMWIEQITIIKANFSPPYCLENKELYSVNILTSDTTKIIIPLTPV